MSKSPDGKPPNKAEDDASKDEPWDDKWDEDLPPLGDELPRPQFTEELVEELKSQAAENRKKRRPE